MSQHLRRLQDYYEVRLVRRQGRRLQLTDAGAALAADLHCAFDQLEAAIRRLEPAAGPARLRVSAPPTLAARWLVSRLGQFRQAHPSISLDLIVSERVLDLRREPVDLAVRYGEGPWPDLAHQRLGPETLTPVCAEAYLARHPLRTPADLRDATLIEDASLADRPDFPTWATWLAEARVSGVAPAPPLSFSCTLLAVQAALDGLGVVLAGSLAVADDVARGRLVEPFPGARIAGWSYNLVAAPEAFRQPKVQAFAAWIAQAWRDAPPGGQRPAAAAQGRSQRSTIAA